jgi:uncharacterized membrane protein HdeD (DUF308 family)
MGGMTSLSEGMSLENRRIYLLTGFFLLLTGILALFRPDFSSAVPALILCASGLALLGLYAAKRRAALLVGGVYALYLGLAWFLAPYRDGFFSLGVLLGMFFAVPGASALALAFERRAAKLAAPACGAVWLGMFFLFAEAYFFRNNRVTLFFLCAALGVLTFHLFTGIQRSFRAASKTPLLLASGMGVIAVICLDKFRVLYHLGEALPYIFGAAAIIAAVTLILKAVIRR